MGEHKDHAMEADFVASGSVYPKVTAARIDQLMQQVTFSTHIVPGTTTTIATATLQVGAVKFTLANEFTACVDLRNFNAEKGAKYAIEKTTESARNKLWELEGYALAQQFAFGPERAAKVAHEVNRAFCIAIGDHSQLPWEQSPEWQRQSAINGVNFRLKNPAATPDANHVSWMAEKVADGWVYGEVKDAEKKTHPCIVPYDQLPFEQRVKDYLFTGSVIGAQS